MYYEWLVLLGTFSCDHGNLNRLLVYLPLNIVYLVAAFLVYFQGPFGYF